MNIYVSKELKEKYPTYEFVGKPSKRKDGKTYMRAYHKIFMRKLFYCFEDDFFWFNLPSYEAC